MIRTLAAALILCSSAAFAQETETEAPLDLFEDDQSDVVVGTIRAETATGALLRGLDKLNAIVTDLPLTVGESATLGRLSVTLGECRYPADNQSGEAFAWLTVSDPGTDTVLFEGWMIATSPALNALDHPRYDVWVVRCTTA